MASASRHGWLSGDIQVNFALMQQCGHATSPRPTAIQEFYVFHKPKYLSLRATTALIAIGCAIVLHGMSPATAQRLAAAPEVSVEELMKPTELPDIAIGSADAKVTVIEYSSLTCGHCGDFQTNVFPGFKAKYIDTGKVRFISRDFPLDKLAATAAMLARCVDPSKSFDLIETLFATQTQWVQAENRQAKLFEIAKQAGFTTESFDKCIADTALLAKFIAVRKRASETFQIASTPTFFINGKRLTGSNRLADFDKVIEPLLGAK